MEEEDLKCGCNFELEKPCGVHREAYELFRIWVDFTFANNVYDDKDKATGQTKDYVAVTKSEARLD